jgi:hypothetical protein
MMNVKIKELNADMNIKQKGIEIDVTKDNKHVGDLRITKTKVTWCPGKVGHKSSRSKQLVWSKFISLMEKN